MKKYYVCILVLMAFICLTGFESPKENLKPITDYKDFMAKDPFAAVDFEKRSPYVPGEPEIVITAQDVLAPEIGQFELPETVKIHKEPEIIYNGMAVLGDKAKAFIKDTVSGKSYTLGKGQIEDEILVLEIFKDKVLLKVKGEPKEVLRQE
ncbi:hypothetical protein KKC59_02290 [bacterium]|nr:hypothetical protein [bacterium]